MRITHLQSHLLIINLLKKDIRNLEKKDIENFDAVIHLAAISNDPLGEIKENITNQINRDATVRIAELSKSNNVKGLYFFLLKVCMESLKHLMN